MKKNEIITNFANYRNYTQNTNYKTKPIKGTNSGCGGRTFEYACKLAIGNYKGAAHISAAKQKDTFKSLDGDKASFEIKSGCGVLANIDENGKYYGAMMKSEYVIYCPDYDENLPVYCQAYVLPVQDFIDILQDLGLIRLKMSGAQYANGERKSGAFYDRLTIQSFKNSKKKTAAFYDALNKYADNMEVFFNRFNIIVNKEF